MGEAVTHSHNGNEYSQRLRDTVTILPVLTYVLLYVKLRLLSSFTHQKTCHPGSYYSTNATITLNERCQPTALVITVILYLIAPVTTLMTHSHLPCKQRTCVTVYYINKLLCNEIGVLINRVKQRCMQLLATSLSLLAEY